MSNDLYNKFTKIDDYLQKRATLRKSIEKELRLQELYQNDFSDRDIILHTKKINSFNKIEEKQKIKRKWLKLRKNTCYFSLVDIKLNM